MRNLSLLLASFLVVLGTCSNGYAQTPKKPDVIQKLDNTSLEVVIDEINKTDILYRKPNDPKGPLYGIPKKDVRRIVWSNGEVEEITVPPAPAQKPGNPTALLVKRPVPPPVFWNRKGLFLGLRLGAGAGLVATPTTDALANDPKLAYQAGATLGYRIKALSVQIDALYTNLTYGLIVPQGTQEITAAEGQQQNLMVPLTFTLSTRLSKVRVGVTLGGYAAVQVGQGSTRITSAENAEKQVRNCAECTDAPTYGVVGGLSATLVEKRGYVIVMDARWYQSLENNEQYRIAESGVKMHQGMLGLGVLFNLSGKSK
ncbi:hypothetical protein [Salmonirosea aquatica]|uniref:Outer membrane beta-barrel protein n=1 Tax=Salmonirosea aquatica TaxID=2654236 RepID=A0A7C9FT08_9BACT|nr:hypothetical protein [Cytophagaceae bacterium SJW1-29]